MDIDDIGANIIVRWAFTRTLDDAAKKKICECELKLASDPKKEFGIDNFFICYQKEILNKIVKPKMAFPTSPLLRK